MAKNDGVMLRGKLCGEGFVIVAELSEQDKKRALHAPLWTLMHDVERAYHDWLRSFPTQESSDAKRELALAALFYRIRSGKDQDPGE